MIVPDLDGSDTILVAVNVENHGEGTFSVFAVASTWRLTNAFQEAAKTVPHLGRIVPAIPDLTKSDPCSPPYLVRAGHIPVVLDVRIGAVEVGEHISKSTNELIRIASDEWPNWIAGEIEIRCRGTTGRVAADRLSVKWQWDPFKKEFV